MGFDFWVNRSKKIAAGIFGFGLGWFIDEIGKFLTMDYNYFFQPAIIFIYIFFVLFFILYRYLEKIQPKTTKELLYNAIDRLEEVVVDDLEKSERIELLSEIKRGDEQEKRLARDLYKLVVKSKYIEDKNSLNEKIWQKLKGWGYAIFSKKITLSILIMVAIGYVVVGLADTAILWTRFKQNELWDFWVYGKDLLTRTDIWMFSLKAIADLLTSIMFGIGIFWVLRKRR
jgi:large-conductance mechanosensitive channel